MIMNSVAKSIQCSQVLSSNNIFTLAILPSLLKKIDSDKLETYGIFIMFFWLDNKNKKLFFSEKILFQANISMIIALEILFLTLTIVKINLNDGEFKERSFIAANSISTIRRMKYVWKKDFAIAALDLNNEIIVIYVASLYFLNIKEVHLFSNAKIDQLKFN